MEMFEIVNSKKEMLDYSAKLCDFPENYVFYILHTDIKKAEVYHVDREKDNEKKDILIDEKDTSKDLQVITIKEPETLLHEQ
jgi:hypothetical protein